MLPIPRNRSLMKSDEGPPVETLSLSTSYTRLFLYRQYTNFLHFDFNKWSDTVLNRITKTLKYFMSNYSHPRVSHRLPLIYSCTTLPMTDFHIHYFHALNMAIKLQLYIATRFDHSYKLLPLYPAHDVTNMVAQ